MDPIIVRKIKTLKRIEPNSSWLADQKSFLLSEISKHETQEQTGGRFPRSVFIFTLVAIILISSLVTVGVISAAQNSLPGDFLYPLKTALEQTQLSFSAGEESKTKLSIKFASQRIDEFTQLVDKGERKEDIEKTVKKFTAQLVSVQESIDKLKEKNAQKAAEVAKLVKSQTPLYQETLVESTEKLAYVLPQDKEDLKENIDQALIEVSKTEEITEGLIIPEEEPSESSVAPEGASEDKEEALVPAEEEAIESPSIPFENLQPEEAE